MKHHLAGLLLVLAISSSCSGKRDFNRESLREQADPTPVITDQSIAKVLSLKAQLPHPFKVAVYLRAPQSGQSQSRYPGPARWHWRSSDLDRVITAFDGLKLNHEVSDAFELSPDAVNGTDVKALRLAAAHQGADALLIVSGIDDMDSYPNAWAWTYVAIVPMFCVPGTVTDEIFITRASLWDVRNGYLYLASEGESSQTQSASLVGGTDALVHRAQREALTELTNQLTEQLNSMAKPKKHRGKSSHD